MTSSEFGAVLRARAGRLDIVLSESEVLGFEAYFRLLSEWNSTINLTALPLSAPTDETFDRLLIEPLTAASLVENTGSQWFDLGSGGGSPAIPLKIVRPMQRLVMVESKERKAAFLREAVRVLKLDGVHVVTGRFQDLPGTRNAHLVTARAVRPDAELFTVAAKLLSSEGRLLIFHSRPEELAHPGFVRVPGAPSIAVFHVEQTR